MFVLFAASASPADIRPQWSFSGSDRTTALDTCEHAWTREVQNGSVPLSVNLSTSWDGGRSVNEQLPSGLRTSSARPLTIPVKLPVTPVNCPAPPWCGDVPGPDGFKLEQVADAIDELSGRDVF